MNANAIVAEKPRGLAVTLDDKTFVSVIQEGAHTWEISVASPAVGSFRFRVGVDDLHALSQIFQEMAP